MSDIDEFRHQLSRSQRRPAIRRRTQVAFSRQAAQLAEPADRFGNGCDGKSTSSAVLNRPRPKRRLARTRSSSKPKARKTWLGSGLADVQALPELTARSLHVHHQGLAVDIGEADVQDCRAAAVSGRSSAGPLSDTPFKPLGQPVEKPVAQRRPAARASPAFPPGRARAPWQSRRCRAR